MGLRTRVLAVLAVGAAMLPVTASAATVSTGVPGAPPSPPPLPQHQLVASGSLNFVNINNDFTGILECDAQATPDAVAVAITSCTVDNQSAPARGLSGPAVATLATVKGKLGDRLDICWTAIALFAEDTLGPLVVQTSGCNLLSPGA
ncbi:MAG TPA: hypothetical protein VGQ42_02700 [Candidatus Dormibacteraeota bacterium]|jgi:hypothetical protein|nr:hypothetical protein [Candidatus Dormibacteraeota bacterium]